MLGSLKTLFIEFQVVCVNAQRTLDEAARNNYHAAIWGNLQIDDTSERVGDLGARQLMAIRVSNPRALRRLSRRNATKLRRFFRSIDFVWDGSLIVFDPKFGAGITLHHRLGTYQQKE